MPIKLYNTLTKKKEVLRPKKGKTITYYTCGPTVYQRAHIGNLRTYINEDVLKRSLILNGYKVKHVMNITDVGHLEHDSDEGEDKMEKEARERKLSAWDIAREFENIFKDDLRKLNIIFPDKFPRATDHIKEQIDLIKKLEKKGFTYKTSDGIYFDTSKFKSYGTLVKAKLKGIQSGARIKMGEKRNPTDFALWKFSHRAGNRQMEWPSPWGVGFPGWHIECSAMSIKYLGIPIDIHAGGIDHVHPHHTNEIAQSEAAYGKKFVTIWMHNEFLRLKDSRMGKSEGNAITLNEIEKNEFDPLDFRYLTFTAHYRSPLSFTWESLMSARSARKKLEIKYLNASTDKKSFAKFKKNFLAALNDDLNIPRALALVWKSKDRDSILFADKIFGLGLDKIKKVKATEDVEALVQIREGLRKEKKWVEADEVRGQVFKLGYIIDDTPEGPKLKKTG